jgi:hypothetical protein
MLTLKINFKKIKKIYHFNKKNILKNNYKKY